MAEVTPFTSCAIHDTVYSISTPTTLEVLSCRCFDDAIDAIAKEAEDDVETIFSIESIFTSAMETLVPGFALNVNTTVSINVVFAVGLDSH